MVTKERAVELVKALLSRRRQESPWMARLPELAVCEIKEHALGWLVVWQSVEYNRSRDIGKMLVGHGPYLVDRRDGSIHHIPATAYVAGVWEELYLQQIRGVRPPDRLVAAAAALVHSEGTMAAMRHLRQQAPLLGLQQAKACVMAVRDGDDPPEELVDLTWTPERCPPLPISTLAGPVR
ncbi:YrhB domain-containing protein [Streptomyces sp. DH10]|uniref:YrhB domain-containing protein n=1 Tax=Streptomyces sp. DH10 TaxID=3040121 RepID=UPI002441D9C0|nr:YrhB domain-containing protein [Streptomyces sp. DH10]MDG9710484.1 YrhB domain-containing protein [Streptomyces sp. DH10]